MKAKAPVMVAAMASGCAGSSSGSATQDQVDGGGTTSSDSSTPPNDRDGGPFVRIDASALPVEGPLSGPEGVFHAVDTAEGRVGSLDVLADPRRAGVFYAFLSHVGIFTSRDWGATWAWKSTDDGVTWQPHRISNDNDPYNFDVDPSSARHVLCAMHAAPNIFESSDGGETWTDRGSAGTGGSNYVFFITSTTWLSIPQDGERSGTRRTTNSGESWTEVAPVRHAHGNAQIFVDPDDGAVYIGDHVSGVYRSTDGAASFTKVWSGQASLVFATGNYIYSMDPGANGAGTPPCPARAARSSPTEWESMSAPPEMNNGMKRAAVAYDPTSNRWVIVGGNWGAGLWRYIEPAP
jgi:hypothetical protein